MFNIKSEADLLKEGLHYNYYYNNLREHSSLGYQTPYEYLKKHMPDINEKIGYCVPIMLDKVAFELDPWSGYSVWRSTRKKYSNIFANKFESYSGYAFVISIYKRTIMPNIQQ